MGFMQLTTLLFMKVGEEFKHLPSDLFELYGKWYSNLIFLTCFWPAYVAMKRGFIVNIFEKKMKDEVMVLSNYQSG